MELKKSKIEESNKKRLESLKNKFNEFKNKKNLIRSSLNDLDLNDKKTKKIIFSDSDSEKKKEKHEETNSVIFQKTNSSEKKKIKLIDSEFDSDSDFLDEKNDEQKKEAFKMFESKINMEEKKANKLVYLKSKFSNDDSRFKIDDRFVEDEDDAEVSEKKESEKISKKELKKENLNSLKILEEITGKQIIKPKSLQEKENDLKIFKLNKLANLNATTQNKMVRYDPTKSNHKVYEVENSESDSSSDSSEEEKIDESEKNESEKNESENDDSVQELEKKEEVKKFFQVEPNLKELFSSNDVFKFKFTNEIEENDENQNQFSNLNKNQIYKNQFLRDIGLEKFKKSSYSSSETESENEESNIVNREKNIVKIDGKKNENRSFLPNFDQDEHLKNALSFFCRPKDFDIENVRKEWLIKRDTLLKESKKKHKKMIRIKRTKDNNNMLPWKKSFKEKNHYKKRKNIN